jgi:hypothetical protein
LLYIGLRVIYVHAKGKGAQRKRRTKTMWKKGSLKIEDQIFTYCAKVYGEASEEYGIEGGKISKLEIRLGDYPVARYDRGWDIEPETENAQLALLAILHSMN